MERFDVCSPCLFGLESVLAFEMKKLGFENVSAADGNVSFNGTANDIARANIGLRCAERVMILLATFKAETFDELFEGVKRINFGDFINKKDAFPVTGWSINSKLHSIPDCQSIIKKAAVESMKRTYRTDWFDETGNVVQIRFSILKDTVKIMLDTSGVPLHKRGYRAHSNAAPLKETLAAGIVDLAHVKNYTTIYDPFCGSGTFLIEAAMKAMNIAPGIRRKFLSEGWGIIGNEPFKLAREEALSQIDRNVEFMAYGSDIDPESIKLTEENAKKAGVESKITLNVAGIKDFAPSALKGTVVCNPPYGERMLDINNARDIYKTMGRVMRKKDGYGYYVISPDDSFEICFGRNADKRRKLYNGMIKCQLYMYYK